jgi:hypothetical protein
MVALASLNLAILFRRHSSDAECWITKQILHKKIFELQEEDVMKDMKNAYKGTRQLRLFFSAVLNVSSYE